MVSRFPWVSHAAKLMALGVLGSKSMAQALVNRVAGFHMEFGPQLVFGPRLHHGQ